uniref:RBR-type E3 ubiquitin transferase n=1 Tax=Clastoptera arizonana TaxID=38151 RepID=A0A1B6EB56_9HEMI
MSDEVCQTDELGALHSIFTDEEFKNISDGKVIGGQLFINITTANNIKIVIRNVKGDAGKLLEELSFDVKYLPPIEVEFNYPFDYPSKNPPNFILSCPWLTYKQLTSLCEKLNQLWERNEGSEIMFTWAQFLKEDSLSFLGITDCLELNCYGSDKNVKDQCMNTVVDINFDKGENDLEDKHKIFESALSNNFLSERNLNDISNMPISNLPISNLNITRPNENNEIEIENAFKHCIGESQEHQKYLHLFLQNFNREKMKMEFLKNVYTCYICFMDKLGQESIQFHPCEHVFCRLCITEFFEIKIREGAVHNITCPEPKCTSEAIPSQVQELVSPQSFTRYDSILLETTLDTMKDIIYCPRAKCRYPSTKDEDGSMARCPICEYTFCVQCKMVYHGVEPCKFKAAEKKIIYEKYQTADGKTRHEMELKYGKKALFDLLETTLSENWIINNSKKCPNCNAAIEKSDGCNKMACGKCGTFFCWLCEVRLDPTQPYKHFRDRSSRCFNQLFQGMMEDDQFDDHF